MHDQSEKLCKSKTEIPVQRAAPFVYESTGDITIYRLPDIKPKIKAGIYFSPARNISAMVKNR